MLFKDFDPILKIFKNWPDQSKAYPDAHFSTCVCLCFAYLCSASPWWRHDVRKVRDETFDAEKEAARAAKKALHASHHPHPLGPEPEAP